MTPAESGQTITRKSGSNLAIAFSFLDKERAEAMSVFYAFCRVVDDIADEKGRSPQDREHDLNEWRRQIALCYTGSPTLPLAVELAPVIQRYSVPQELFDEIIAGVAMDLEPRRFKTWEELRAYCYRVASCVGLVSIEIFGYRNPATRTYAELLGLAFQTTNILRDVKTDFDNDRIYLPDEDFEQAGFTREELARGTINENALRLFRMMDIRSEHYYQLAARALPEEDRHSMVSAQMMKAVYYGVLEKIRANGHDVWHHNARLPKWKKAWLMQQAYRAERPARPTPRPSSKVIVVGGGFAGITAALQLARAGHRPTLLEARPSLGGRTHSYRDKASGLVLDNGQHAIMGCYHETLRLLDWLGARHHLWNNQSLDVPYCSPRGLSRLRSPSLPSPLHIGSALLRFDELNLSEKWSCLEPGLALLMDAEGKRWNSSTVAEWLIACRQSPNAVRALWEPLCLAALNEKIEHASAALFSRVVRRMLLTSSQNASILLSRVGLGDLFIPPAMDFLAATGSPISCGVPATRLIQEGHRITAVETADGRTWTADAFVLATPWRATRALAPEGSALHKTCGTLSGSPIVSIYLWTDREVTPEPMLGLLDSPLQWCFNLNKIRTDIPPNVHLLCFVISAAHKWDGVPPASLIAMAEKEMKRLLPQAADAKVLRGFPYRALDATLRAIPEYQAHRPDTLTEWSNLFLAGDWTNTGLPSTIEGAVLSGLRAAETLENRETF